MRPSKVAHLTACYAQAPPTASLPEPLGSQLLTVVDAGGACDASVDVTRKSRGPPPSEQ